MRIQRKISKGQSVLPSQILLALALAVGVILLVIVIGGNQHSVQASRTQLQSSRTMMMDPIYDRSFSSLTELKQASDLVVLGTITNQRVVLNSHRVPSTISTIQVERTLKGAIASGQSVEMKQLGGVMPGGQHWALEGFPVLSLHARYLFFLVPAFSKTPNPLPNVYYPVGAPQGIYVVNANGKINSISQEAERMGISIQNVVLDDFIAHVQKS